MDEFYELREALQRLKVALQQAMGTLTQLNTSLHDLAWRVYREHQCPFGDSEVALKIWLTYEQYTTRN